MTRTQVNSNSGFILSVGYDPAQQEAEIEFKGGKVFRYSDVPADIGNELVESATDPDASTGKLFHAKFKNVFAFERI